MRQRETGRQTWYLAEAQACSCAVCDRELRRRLGQNWDRIDIVRMLSAVSYTSVGAGDAVPFVKTWETSEVQISEVQGVSVHVVRYYHDQQYTFRPVREQFYIWWEVNHWHTRRRRRIKAGKQNPLSTLYIQWFATLLCPFLLYPIQPASFIIRQAISSVRALAHENIKPLTWYTHSFSQYRKP